MKFESENLNNDFLFWHKKEGCKVKDIMKRLGSWIFLIGVAISVIVGLIVGANWYMDTGGYAAALLAILGFIVGVLSFFAMGTINKADIPNFLIAAVLLVGVGSLSTFFGNINLVGTFFENIVGYLGAFIAPAACLLAIRIIWDIGKGEELSKIIPKKQ